ncbi:ATP-binding cassette domain-containing protein [Leifsonia sp. Root112D2]|uniref:ATP-binding cassette domain-containing protein n=1 Tax=Leifsonia sp. Root112D2 TaxID=1736426 RepID=UPI0006F3E58B|nr:ATP-binding cassette domain-containing protein [Leifsonia sp. Root112D2]KQV05239.1 ABC transporter [Leifsonia sp. Root112D2]
MTSDAMIVATGLRKSYGGHAVLDGVDIRVNRGEIFAMLGPNGAGKTTTVNILTTLIKPDAGTARIAGHELARRSAMVRSAISLTGQYASVDEFQTGEENLRMMCTLAHLGGRAAKARTARLLAQFELVHAAKRLVSTYSGGMRRRLDLAISLVASPSVVFLDEPTTGLDPRSRAQMWEIVRELAAEGTTIFLTTQYLEEADQLADRIAVLDGGRVIAEGTADELKSRLSGEHVEFAFDDAASFAAASALTIVGAHADPETLSLRVPTTNPVETIGSVLAHAGERGLTIANITIIKPSLDDVFLALTGHAASTDTAAAGQSAETEEVAA